MFYPYKQVEEAAKQNPPPAQGEGFPTVKTVIALYLVWLLFFRKKFQAEEVMSNALTTATRVSKSKLIRRLKFKHFWTRDKREKKRLEDEAWSSYQSNLWNTVSGTCATAITKRELGKLNPDSLIKWLPSVAREIDPIHFKEYFKVMTVREAQEKELCTRYGCKCGWIRK